MTFNLSNDIVAFREKWNGLGADQMPFATALALTRVAKEAQGAIVRGLGAHFILRNDFVPKGFRILVATKENLESVVYSKDPFMALQETGGEKLPTKGASVPDPANVRGNVRDIIPKVLQPGRIVRSGKAFEMSLKSGKRVIARNAGSGRMRGLEILYYLQTSQRVVARLGMHGTVGEVVQNRFQDLLRDAFFSAVAG